MTSRQERPKYALQGERGLYLISYNRPLFEDLKLKREGGDIRDKVSYIYCYSSGAGTCSAIPD